MPLPTLDPLWRPNGASTRNDRELIRSYADLPASEFALQGLTTQMNAVAKISPPSVTRVQLWIDEVETLTADHAAEVEDKTAHLGAVKSFEGLRPGKTPTRDDLRSEAGPVKWDTETLYKVRYEAGTGAAGTAVGQREARINTLKRLILTALSIEPMARGTDGYLAIERS